MFLSLINHYGLAYKYASIDLGFLFLLFLFFFPGALFGFVTNIKVLWLVKV